MSDRSPAGERKLRRIVGSGTTLLRLLGRSWRMRRVDYEPVAELRRRRQPLVFALWHGELFPLLWVHRDEGVSVLISEHRDGEIIARVAERVGFATVRGSTSRGGGRALLGLTRVLKQGGDIAITPDGPRGPAHRYAPGALIAAQRAGAPIVPVAIHVDRAYRFESWDRFAVPWPWARVTVAYGAPTWVEA
ncbi:MAG TPA: lysophospholipid acyltransferase family protein, partial [Gemmatimonadaceae bacterium]|nr:lysophospholipid acyltransferase family protein [Gemmatimonadaceae bacterium]